MAPSAETYQRAKDPASPAATPKLTVASILSDLTSLRVCDHPSANALVSAYSHHDKQQQGTSASSASSTTTATTIPSAAARKSDAQRNTDPDPALYRAHTLLDLYQTVKLAYSPPTVGSPGHRATPGRAVSYDDAKGTLAEARADVARAKALLDDCGREGDRRF